MATDAAVHSTLLTPAELHIIQQMTSIVTCPPMTALTLLCSVPDKKKKKIVCTMLCSAVAQAVVGTSQEFRRTYFELQDVINLNSVNHIVCLDSV
jgi:hypothetical protein